MDIIVNSQRCELIVKIQNTEKFSIESNKESQVTIPTDSEISVSNEQNSYNKGRWTLEEHKRFLSAIFKYGNNWMKVQESIGTRSATQTRSHAQKFFIRLRKNCEDEDCSTEELLSILRNKINNNSIELKMNQRRIRKRAKKFFSIKKSKIKRHRSDSTETEQSVKDCNYSLYIQQNFRSLYDDIKGHFKISNTKLQNKNYKYGYHFDPIFKSNIKIY